MILRRRARGESQRPRWTLSDVLWLFVPVLSLLLIVGYFVAAASLGANPPFSVVSGQSMRPTFAPGDLVVIEGVAAAEVEVDDIISIVPPIREQEEKGLPAEIVHRVVEVVDTDGQRTFLTKGDNNPGEDAFITFPSNIRGEVVGRAPALGFPVLFFRSDQGRIFAIAAGLALVGYFVISAIERRQEAAALENPRALIEEVREENHEIMTTVKELVGAVSEYGEHLRSHTGAVQGMSAASQELATVAADLRGSIAVPTVPASAEAPPADPARPVAAEPDAEPSTDEAAAFLEELLGMPDPPAERSPVQAEPMREAVHRQGVEVRFETRPSASDLRTELLEHLLLTAADGWLDVDLNALSTVLGAPAPALESSLAHLALQGHLRAVATHQSVSYLVRLR